MGIEEITFIIGILSFVLAVYIWRNNKFRKVQNLKSEILRKLREIDRAISIERNIISKSKNNDSNFIFATNSLNDIENTLKGYRKHINTLNSHKVSITKLEEYLIHVEETQLSTEKEIEILKNSLSKIG